VLEPQELRFKNIGRFTEEQIIRVSDFAAFTQVDGVNRNTGGSSGSGKTTVFNALSYLLGLNDNMPATVLQSRLTKDGICVTGIFTVGTKTVTITRNKGKIKIEEDREGDVAVIEGSNALGEEYIDTLLGMPRDLFRKILHKRQKEGGFFIDMTASEKHDFLIDCLGLEDIRKKGEIVDHKVASLNEKRESLMSELLTTTKTMETNDYAISTMGKPPVKEMHREVIIELKEKLDKAEAAYKEAAIKCDLEMKALMLEKPDVSVTAYDTTALDQYQKEKREIEDLISASLQAEKDRIAKVRVEITKIQNEQKDLKRKIADADQAQKEALAIAEKIKKIRACACPTCEQIWNTESSKAHEAELLKQLSQLKETIGFKGPASELVAKNEGLLSDLQAQTQGQVHPESPVWHERLHNRTALVLAEKKKQQEHLDSQNSANRMILHVFEEKRQNLLAGHSVYLNQYKGTVDVNRRTLDIAVNKLKSYEEAKKRYDDTIVLLEQKKKELTDSYNRCSLDISATERELMLAEEMKKCIKMYLSYSFDEALESIGTKATEIIRCIPNMSNATIQFDSTKETKDGKIKEEVNAVIGMDGEIGIPIKSLSGGERSAADLAVDLAVIDFIEMKSAKGANIFILDEPFTGLGSVEIEMALEVLKNSNTNKKIIIVDHNPIVGEMFSHKVKVIREGTISRIAV
jgi:DNA repair exonuclease SbcCD ATPase subunit